MRLPDCFGSQRLWWALTAFSCLFVALAGTNRAAPGGAAAGGNQAVDPQAAEFFETKVRPVLANNCYSCHGASAQAAGLRLDTKAGLLKGSDSGPVLVAGDPAKSPLIGAVHQDGKIKMPPGGKLKPEEIEALSAWVTMGAPWPDADVSPSAQAAAETGEYVITPQQQRFWSFQPVRKPPLPAVKNAAWAVSPVDRFVLAKLEARGLKPSKSADRRTLIRRVTFDLTGLPPTPAEVDAFVRDRAPGAFARVVDRLLASPRYGERWARHWLDVARYADTKGYLAGEADRNYPHAYNYRDWVVRAFNEDLPYDRFLLEQLAADRLPLGDDKRPLAALGFVTVGRRFLNNPHDITDDRIDVTMRGLQGLTVACARCHDHKFDPIPTKDYYSLYGVFASSVEPDPQPISPKAISEPYAAHDKQVKDAEREEEALIREQVALLRERVKKNEALPDPVRGSLQKVKEKQTPRGTILAKLEPAFEPSAQEQLKALRPRIEALKKSYPATPELAMTLADAPNPVTPRVFRRGNSRNPGDPVPRRFLQILSPRERPAWTDGSGRLELARAIASKDNPLTARVMVNRIWLHHFGAGLVRTPSDFGRQGERPTHPELLDYLAWRFMEGGWSVKKMHRLILLSNTYQQDSGQDPKSFARDPENRLLWRMNRRRLELEALRDSLLFVTGRLDDKAGGPSVELWKAPFPTRRTLYGRIDRQNLPGVFRTFDFASPDTSTGQRFRTTVPQQALFLMNSPFVVEQAHHLAARPDVSARQDTAGRIRYLYYLLYGRVPTAEETALGERYLRAAALAPATAPAREEPAWRHGYGAYDAAAQRVSDFTPLPHWTGDAWQASRTYPDPTLAYLRLTATGGHVGGDDRRAAVRRWVAPQDGDVTVRGTIGHGSPEGDGVHARIVSSREGLLGEWTAQNNKAETIVQKTAMRKGDTLDFVVSCRANANFDSFTWSPTIALAGGSATWSAEAQFRGPAETIPRLNPWERYAQALLMTNEFMFVD